MNAVFAIAAVLVSTAAVVHLTRTDPKRRRVFGLPDYENRRRTGASLALLFAPGAALLVAGDGAGFTIWLGALTVLGWGIAAMSPAQAGSLRSGMSAFAGCALTRTASGWRGAVHGLHAARAGILFLRDGGERIALLEARIDRLEAELQEVEASTRQPDSTGNFAGNRDLPGTDNAMSRRDAVGR